LQNNSVYAPIIDALDNVITTEDNDFLIAPFQPQEFKDSMFSVHPDKCLGLDGFNPGFFQQFWSICSSDFFQECCLWLNNNQFPPSLNSTNIALIPKEEEQKSMKDWQTIAL